jgi:hypothetical protein
MKKLLLIVICALLFPAIAFTFSSCKKKTYTCVCISNGYRTTYEITAVSKSAAEKSCDDQSGDCSIE